ncbi:40S ribosomal protein S10b-like [Anopheles moucheti]|uniref:40S ribosomal protein S10b-like n=1 Tax=Anopheles moucheti TaxID=186751 RepID=UPI0022F00D9F|nr:40S ribosomal protein S10b-like [Anopheles moucheti]
MYIRKSERKAIYRALFESGVLVAFGNHHPKRMHCELKSIRNLHVIKTMESLVSRHLVVKQFSWNWYYWRLTNDGIIYLRNYLHIPDQLVPSTLIARSRAVPNVASCPPTNRGFPDPRDASDRGIYRRLEPRQGYNKRDNAGPGTNEMVFRGGFERGRRNEEH